MIRRSVQDRDQGRAGWTSVARDQLAVEAQVILAGPRNLPSPVFLSFDLVHAGQRSPEGFCFGDSRQTAKSALLSLEGNAKMTVASMRMLLEMAVVSVNPRRAFMTATTHHYRIAPCEEMRRGGGFDMDRLPRLLGEHRPMYLVWPAGIQQRLSECHRRLWRLTVLTMWPVHDIFAWNDCSVP